MCQHGDRRMARMNAPIHSPAPVFETIADRYEGKRFNSPNDAVYRSNGDLFFTDPPYGLEGNADDPARELPFQGVFKVNGNGEVTLITDMLTRPNGLAFFQGERRLVVANSDPDRAYWTVFDLDSTDAVTGSRILYDATPDVKGRKGLPDGLKVDRRGTIFATGPGGVYVLNEAGELLGKIDVPEACSNIALANEDRTMYITADRYVLRLKMRK
jgi:gluconolactonase